jgi:hypothetical protein
VRPFSLNSGISYVEEIDGVQESVRVATIVIELSGWTVSYSNARINGGKLTMTETYSLNVSSFTVMDEDTGENAVFDITSATGEMVFDGRPEDPY